MTTEDPIPPRYYLLIIRLLVRMICSAVYFRTAKRVRIGDLPRYAVIDLNNGRTRGIFLFVVVSSIFLLGLVSTVSYQAYHFSESVTFCGEVCHSVMEPEYTAYRESPHARVTCAECHVGSGAGWYVRSKLSGAYQVYSVLFQKYPRPVPTPVHSLRPAQETCEQCHWPEKFFGAQLKVITRFAHDEKNSVRQISSLLRTGGGSPTSGINSGIHWHMNIGNEVWYGASDPQRQKIPWVRIKDRQGKVTEYFDRSVSLSAEQLKKLDIRKMDCIDCHNRPSHIFRDPDGAVDLALLTGLIDSTLPYIKQQAVHALSQNYSSKENAKNAIATALGAFYLKQYPKVHEEQQDAIKKAISEVQKIYRINIFPEMKVDWRTHPDNVGHTLFPGCFRCHEGNHVSREGKVQGLSALSYDHRPGNFCTQADRDSGGRKIRSLMATDGKTRASLLQSMPSARQRVIDGLHNLPYTSGGRSHGRASLCDMPSQGTTDQAAGVLYLVPSEPH